MATSAQTSQRPSGAIHPIAPSRLKAPSGRPDLLPMGVWIWLASELMFFAALFAAYFMIRQVTSDKAAAGAQTLWQSESSHLNVVYAAVNTLILVLSSVTCQMGVHAAEHGRVRRTKGLAAVTSWGMREWYTLTFVMGTVFIAGQALEYANLVSEGHTMQSSVFYSLFFIATGFHGLHVTGGLVAFLFTLGRTYLARRFTHEQAVTAMVVSYYWHFVDVVWIILFSVIYIIQ